MFLYRVRLNDKIREIDFPLKFIAENESIQERAEATLFLKTILDEHHTGHDELEKFEVARLEESSPRHRGPNIIYESKISELEVQLTQTKIELRKAQEENQENLRRYSGHSAKSNEFLDLQEQLRRALIGKSEAETKVEILRQELSMVRCDETEIEIEAKRALELAQHASFEKSQMESDLKRLKDELDKKNKELAQVIHDSNRRLLEEKKQMEKRFSQQLEQLTADATSQWETASKSYLEIEKQRREISDLKREVMQKDNLIEDLKKDIRLKTSKFLFPIFFL